MLNGGGAIGGLLAGYSGADALLMRRKTSGVGRPLDECHKRVNNG